MKKEESRDFDVFFVFGREEKYVEMSRQRAKPRKISFFFIFLEVLGAFYSLNMLYEAASLVGLPPSNGLRLG